MIREKTAYGCLALLLCGALYGCSPSKGKPLAATPEGYKLVWADEFNKDGAPDPANWTYENGFVRNEELQWYQQENARCKKGLLVITVKREKKPNPLYEEGSKDWRKKRQYIEYTGACLKTPGLHSWQYGRFEMRGRISTDAGLWPAWWTLGEKGEWPSNGEIDIMEYYKGGLLANIACGTSKRYHAEWYSKISKLDSLGGKTWADKFHVWRMDWDETAIALYVDDVLLNRVPMEKLANKDGTGINPFKQPHYMLLNFAIGGMNGGDPANTTFPRHFEVDYVRVYQRQ